MEEKRSWHLDKKVTVSIVIILFVNIITTIVSTVWWVSKVDFQITTLDKLPDRISILEKSQEDQYQKIIILETKLKIETEYLRDLRVVLTELSATLAKATEKQASHGSKLENLKELVKEHKQLHHKQGEY